MVYHRGHGGTQRSGRTELCDLCGETVHSEAEGGHQRLNSEQIQLPVIGSSFRIRWFTTEVTKEHRDQDALNSVFLCDLCGETVHSEAEGGHQRLKSEQIQLPVISSSFQIRWFTTEDTEEHRDQDALNSVFLCDLCGETVHSEAEGGHQRLKSEQIQLPVVGSSFQIRWFTTEDTEEHRDQDALNSVCLCDLCGETVHSEAEGGHQRLNSEQIQLPVISSSFQIRWFTTEDTEDTEEHRDQDALNSVCLCDLCGEFVSPEAEGGHQRLKSEQIQLPVIGSSFRIRWFTTEDTEEHRDQDALNSVFLCDLCGEFVSPEAEGGHQRLKSEQIQLPVVGSSFQIRWFTTEDTEEHRDQDALNSVFLCDLCGETVRPEAEGGHQRLKSEQIQRCACRLCLFVDYGIDSCFWLQPSPSGACK